MAKARTQNSIPRDSQGSMTFFMFQVKGDDATLQQGFRMIESALGKLAPILPAKQQALSHRTLSSEQDGEVIPTPELDEDEEVDQELVVDADPIVREKVKRTKKPSKIPEVLKDFDPNSSTPTLKEYMAGKPTNSNFKKYLAVCAFFHEVHDLKAIGVQHIFTCFRLLSWPVPDDLEKPFANLAQAKKLDRQEKGTFAINLLGLNDLSGQGD